MSKYQTGFRKGYSSQHCLFKMVEKWKQALDNGDSFGALLTDLSKAFDCIPHDLLIAKLYAYGFDKASLKLLHSYLSERKQRVKIEGAYSSWQVILYGVQQGSILGPLLFNIFICDLFFDLDTIEIAGYADDNTPYVSGENIEFVINKLESISVDLFKWFAINGMKANPDKCHLLLSTKNEHNAKISKFNIKNSKSEKLLGVTIDSELKFDEHINSLCAKTNQKLSALSRLVPFMNLNKRKTLMSAFISSQFQYCKLIWMNHSRKLNNKINRVHEKALRITYKDHKSTFEELLVMDNSVTIHVQNLRALMTEMFRVKIGETPEIMNNVFKYSNNYEYNLRGNKGFKSRKIMTENFGASSLTFLGPKIWPQLPTEIIETKTILEFKNKIKNWVPENCPCRLCKTYIAHVGFI